MAAASVRLGSPRVDEGVSYWTETRPFEGGRTVLIRIGIPRWVDDSVFRLSRS